MSQSPPRAQGNGTVGRPGPRASAHERLQALQSVATRIVRTLDFEATTLAISNAANDLLHADAIGFMLVGDDGTLHMQSCVGHRNIAAARWHAQRGEGVAGIVLQTGLPYRVDDFHDAADITAEVKQLAENESVRCSQGAPLLANGEVTGVVLAWSRRPYAFDDDDQEVLEGLANLAAIAVKNAGLYEDAQQALKNLEVSNSKLQEQNDLLNSASSAQAELTQLMLRGGGLTALVDMISRYTGGDVAVLDPDFEPLAVTPDGDHLAAAVREHLRAAQHSNAHRSRNKGSVLLVREVSSSGDRMAYLCVRLDNDPDKLIPLIVDQASVVCALELTKQRAVLDARVRVRSDFLWDLLEGKIGDEAEANIRARYLGYTLPRKLRVVLVNISGLEQWAETAKVDADAVDQRRSMLLGKLERLATDTGASRVLSARRASALALIVPWIESLADARDFAATVLRGLTKLEPDLKFTMGVSACHELQGDLSDALSQAQTALTSVTGSANPVSIFDDLGILRFLLAPGDRSDLQDFVRRVLGPVIAYDEGHSTHLLETLEAHLAEDRNLGRAAERLYIHPKTVRYRLDRVYDLIKRDLAVQQDSFEVQLALHIMRTLDLSS